MAKLDRNITLEEGMHVVDGTEPPAIDDDAILALLPAYARRGDARVRAAVIAAWRKMLNYAWAQFGRVLAAQKTPRYASDEWLVDFWADITKKPKAPDEDEPSYRARLLTPFDMVTPSAIKTAVDGLVAEVTPYKAAFMEPAIDAVFCSDAAGTAPWAGFCQPSTKRLWALDPTGYSSPTSGAYVVPAIGAAAPPDAAKGLGLFWIVLPVNAGDDSSAPHCTSDTDTSQVGTEDFLMWAKRGWGAETALPSARVDFAAAQLPDGRILVCGGSTTSAAAGSVTSAHIYNPAAAAGSRWTTIASLTTARRLHQAVVLPSGLVMAFGGEDTAGTALDSCELYDPDTNTWFALASMATARSAFRAVTLQSGKVLAIGGVGGITSCELFDPATAAWTATGAIPVATQRPAVVLLKTGQVLKAGGAGSNTSALYDPLLGTWTAMPTMSVIRDYAMAIVMHDGRVLVPGGYNGTVLSSTEIFDPHSKTWTTTTSIPAARYQSALYLTSDGRVAMVAGFDGTNAKTETYIFDPATATWQTNELIGAAVTARYGHAAFNIGAERALVIGGYNASNAPFASVDRLADDALLVASDMPSGFIPRRPDSLMDRINSEVEQRRAGGVGWFAFYDPLNQGAL
jgi:N-acetylneuraminic acid mutarotase